jgi:hypothetical protein
MNDGKQYLEELDGLFQGFLDKIKKLKGNDEAAYHELVEVLHSIVKKETELRDKCDIGVRFNVIHTQLQVLAHNVEEAVQELIKEQACIVEKNVFTLKEDEALVYVYLFNAQGNSLKTWRKLLLPSALIEHSVNRPVYAERSQVEEVIRGKANKDQHAYVEIVVKKEDILNAASKKPLQSQCELLRVRQGSLKTANIRAFVHVDKSYTTDNKDLF